MQRGVVLAGRAYCAVVSPGAYAAVSSLFLHKVEHFGGVARKGDTSPTVDVAPVDDPAADGTAVTLTVLATFPSFAVT
jgi:hypothetical protein